MCHLRCTQGGRGALRHKSNSNGVTHFVRLDHPDAKLGSTRRPKRTHRPPAVRFVLAWTHIQLKFGSHLGSRQTFSVASSSASVRCMRALAHLSARGHLPIPPRLSPLFLLSPIHPTAARCRLLWPPSRASRQQGLLVGVAPVLAS